jgi:hypothetical protein
VVDPDGAKSIDRVTVFPGDTPPEPTISSPSSSFEWSVGAPVDFKGSAEDAEDGDLPSTSLDWVTRLYHCPQACHAHPLQAFPAVSSGSFLAPDHDYPSHIALTLTAVDSRGLAAQRSVEIEPHTVDLEIASNPPGVNLTAGLLTGPAPFSLTVIRGSKVVLSAPANALLGGTTYPWLAWSDGGARTHSFSADHSGRYLARYVPDPVVPTSPPIGGPPLQPQVVGSGLRLQRHPPKRAGSSVATFAFSAVGQVSGFRCQLDRKPPAKCKSPKTYTHLSPGRHTFKVAPVNEDGKAVAKATFFSWKVLAD